MSSHETLSIGDPGEVQVAGYDPDADEFVDAGDGSGFGTGLEGDAPEATPDQVRAILSAMGGLLAWVLADPDVEDLWRFTPRELDDLTPPLVRIVNKRPQLRAAVHRGDEVSVAVVMAGYLGRNLSDKRAAVSAREEHDDGLDDEAGGLVGHGGTAGGPGGFGAPGGGDGVGAGGPAAGQ